jgi:hypothetical protein
MAMMILPPRYVMLDTNGDPISGGKVRVYDAGTTDDRDIFTDSALSVAAANPIIADSGGVLPVRYTATGETKLVFLDASDNVLLTADDVDGGIPAGAGALPVADGGTGATTAAGARTNLSAASQTEVTSIASDVSQLQTDVATAFTGDSGSGGAVGVVPAPAAGDAAADKFVHADGTWKQGAIVQVVVGEYAAHQEIDTSTPGDDSVPLVTEGEAVTSVSITPTDSGNNILVQYSVPAYCNSQSDLILHFHINGASNAEHAVFAKITGSRSEIISGAFVYAPGSTSAQTISLRAGIGGAASSYINGDNSSRLLGGAQCVSIVATELRA